MICGVLLLKQREFYRYLLLRALDRKNATDAEHAEEFLE